VGISSSPLSLGQKQLLPGSRRSPFRTVLNRRNGLLASSSSPKHGAETGLSSQARIPISAGPQRVPEKLHGTEGRKEDEHSQSV